MHIVLSKFVVQKCKRFPPHPNNVSTLPCETQHSCFAGKWHGNETSRTHSFKFEVFFTHYVYSYAVVLLKINCNRPITSYNIKNNSVRESNFLRVSHASLLKRLIKTMECTPKHVTKVAVTENNDKMISVSLKFTTNKQRFI